MVAYKDNPHLTSDDGPPVRLTTLKLAADDSPEGHSSPGCEGNDRIRPLSASERAVLSALTDEFVSATVIKVRSGLPRAGCNAEVVVACESLLERGLAERLGSGLRSTLRWRRTASAGTSLPSDFKCHDRE